MPEFLAENAGTIIVFLMVVACITAIILKMVRDKKKGKTSCGSSCGCCPNSALCHKGKQNP